MNRVRAALFCSVSVFCVAIGYSASLQPLDGIVAIVNKDIITQDALTNNIAMLKKQAQVTGQRIPPESQLRTLVINQLIDQKLVLQAAAKEKITVTDAQLHAAISRIASQNHLTVAQLQQQVIKQGMTLTGYQKQIRQQLIFDAVEHLAINGRAISVSQADVTTALKKTKAQPPQHILEYHLQAIVVPVATSSPKAQWTTAKSIANNIIAQLNQGGDFAAVATSASTAATPLQGGDMGWKQLAQLPPAISAEVAAAYIGSVVGPIQTPSGFYILKVANMRSVNAPQPPAPSAEQVREMLYMQKFQQAVQKWVKQLRAESYIKIIE